MCQIYECIKIITDTKRIKIRVNIVENVSVVCKISNNTKLKLTN